MNLKIFNTLSKKLEIFVPLNETIKDYPLLNYSIYILIYLFFSITGFYVQNKRKKNNDKQINYKSHYKCMN